MYEGINIHRCEKCHGAMVQFERLKAIEARREKSEEDLLNEVASAGEDSRHPIRCGSCLSTMEKRRKKMGSSSFYIDRCQKCRMIWFDPGELAKWQVVYEFSEQGQEAERSRQRLKNMKPSEKAELDERIAKLPAPNVELEILLEMFTEPQRHGRAGSQFWF